jgi:hypothetical protein
VRFVIGWNLKRFLGSFSGGLTTHLSWAKDSYLATFEALKIDVARVPIDPLRFSYSNL